MRIIYDGLMNGMTYLDIDSKWTRIVEQAYGWHYPIVLCPSLISIVCG
jgi:ABC-type xylose transport system permease subunit